MGVLIDGVMAAVERGGADVEALLVGDFFGSDEARGVASTCGGDGGIVGMSEGVAESDAGRGGFYEFTGTAGVEHAGLGGHVGKLFYTGGRAGKLESCRPSRMRTRSRKELRTRNFEEKRKAKRTAGSLQKRGFPHYGCRFPYCG